MFISVGDTMGDTVGDTVGDNIPQEYTDCGWKELILVVPEPGVMLFLSIDVNNK